MINLPALSRFTIYFLVVLVAIQSILSAQTHVVNPIDLQNAVVAATDARQRNMEITSAFLSSTNAQKVLRSVGVYPAQVTTAVSSLKEEVVLRGQWNHNSRELRPL